MRLESEIERMYALGGEPVGISVDSDGRNAAMLERWHLSFRIESDPGGERFLKPLQLWNEQERGGIGIPAVTVLSPDGTEVWSHRSRDFADRPDDSDIFDALHEMGLPALHPPPKPFVPKVQPEENPGAFRTDAFGAYHRGVMFATAALASRMREPVDRAEAQAVSRQASTFIEAWKNVRERNSSG